MARSVKAGIPYFSHDVDMLQDKKIKLLKAKHGLIGYATYIRLLEELYRDKGYYLHIDEDFNILFSDDNNLDLNVYNLILNDCISGGLFNAELHEKYDILTGKRIQDNYFSATARRTKVEFIREYLLSEPTDFYDTTKVNVNIEALIVDNLSLNDDIGTQSKVNEIKEEKTKEELPKLKKEEPLFSDEQIKAIGLSYPGTKNAVNRKKKLPAILKKHGVDIIATCIDRYVNFVNSKKTDKFTQSYMGEERWWNGEYENYLDENYDESVIPPADASLTGNARGINDVCPICSNTGITKDKEYCSCLQGIFAESEMKLGGDKPSWIV